MHDVVLVIHIMVALGIIGLVLIQRSEGGGLGIGGSRGGGMGTFAGAKSTANTLTRMTSIFAGIFFCTSLVLGYMAAQNSKNNTLLTDSLSVQTAPIQQEEAPTAIETPEVPVEGESADTNADTNIEPTTTQEPAEQTEAPEVPVGE